MSDTDFILTDQPMTETISSIIPYNYDPPLITKTVTQAAIQYTLLALCAVTIIANPITLAAMAKSRLVLKSSIHVVITSLCFSDLMMGLAGFTFYFLKISMGISVDSNSLMKARFALATCCVTAFIMSNINCFLITVDRTIATVVPHVYKTMMTTKTTSAAMLPIWLAVAVFVVASSVAEFLVRGDIKHIESPCQVLPAPVIMYFTTPSLIAIMVVNVVLYGFIVRSLVKSGQKVQVQNKSLSEKRNLRVTRMATIVIGVMLLGNVPIVTMATIPVPSNPSAFYMWARNIAYDTSLCFAVLPTFINNIIYVGRLADFSKAVQDLLCCKMPSLGRNHPSLVSPNDISDSRYQSPRTMVKF